MSERNQFIEWYRAAEQDETPQITEPWLPRDVNPLIAEAWQARADLAAERERELVKALFKARHLIEDWSAYADDYFKEKWDLAGDLGEIDGVLDKHTNQNRG